MSIRNQINKTFLTLFAILAVSLSSCDAIYDDLQPCPQGLRLRFVYDYNMEYANAFTSQVDCLTLLVYNTDGDYITTYTADKNQTSDENWRLTFDLAAGDYRLIAYGGMNCDNASFKFASSPDKTLMSNLEVYLPSDLITEPAGTDLHPLFYGTLDVTVPERSVDFTEATVYMMKDTNDIRVLLINENGEPANADDFIFTITDNNTRFNYLNNIISTENVDYRPWAKGNSEIGEWQDGDVTIASWAEFSIPRLIHNSDASLTVTRVADGEPALSIPLVNILELLKSEHFSPMSNQEFLDRESRWNLTFILNRDNVWAGTSIIINNWIVRINDIHE